MSLSLTLKLTQAAKSAGGDKYKVQEWAKESYIYVPQNISRPSGGQPAEVLNCTIAVEVNAEVNAEVKAESSVQFELVKQGKTGDDRYKSVNETVWKGDIYLPHQYRNDSGKVCLNFN